MKVTLVNPPMPYLVNDRASPPLGIMYLAAVLRRAGHRTEIVDLASTPPEDWKIPEGSDFYGVTSATPQYGHALKVKRIIRQKNPNCPIVIGGPHASSLPEPVLADGFDYVVVGEGEHAIVDIVEGAAAPGIVRGKAPDPLDDLPYPARDLIDLSSYSPAMNADRVTTILSARGCPFTCAFCCKKVFHPKTRFRSPENILGEIEEVRDKYGIGGFVFVDDTFTLNRKRLRTICHMLRTAGVIWRCHTRVDRVDRPTLRMLRESGCTEISFGIESGSQAVLDMISKGTTVKQNLSAIKTAREEGLITKTYIGFGWPGDDRESLEATKRLIDEAKPDQCLMGTFAPLPGSDVWENPARFGLKNVDTDFSKFYLVGHGGKAPVVFDSATLDRSEIESLRDDLLGFLRNRGYMTDVSSNVDPAAAPHA